MNSKLKRTAFNQKPLLIVINVSSFSTAKLNVKDVFILFFKLQIKFRKLFKILRYCRSNNGHNILAENIEKLNKD